MSPEYDAGYRKGKRDTLRVIKIILKNKITETVGANDNSFTMLQEIIAEIEKV